MGRPFAALLVAWVAFGGFTAALAGGCGARTGLLESEPQIEPPAGTDGGIDAPAEGDTLAAEEDALPPIDNSVGDVHVFSECPDASATLVYLITEQNDLLSFYPPTLAFRLVGKVSCPGTSSVPFSMAVDRHGVAYSSFGDGQLFQVSTGNAACKATPFVPDQRGFSNFCMGYAGLPDGGERLYVVDCSGHAATNSQGLGWVDTSNFRLSFIGPFHPAEPSCELTGTGDGRLFGFCVKPNGGSSVVQIDPNDARIVAENPLAVGQPNDGFAFAYWGGVFWIFTTASPGATSTVTRWDPDTLNEANVATYPAGIVGAGVSTCAPE